MPPGLTARVRVLATTDLHMHLTGHDYYADRPVPGIGLTRTASLIEAARAEARAMGALTLLFDNGDALQGTPLDDVDARPPGRAHPLMRAFAHLRYDAAGLGNHDFNFGLPALAAALRGAPCPVVCTNLTPGDSPAGFAPVAMLDRSVHAGGRDWPIRIGVLSFVPPQTLQWDGHHLGGHAEIEEIVASARRHLPGLRKAGCDLIVALAHSGLGEPGEVPDQENAVIPLAALDGAEGIDVIVAGHTHLLMPGPAHAGTADVDAETGAVHGKPVIMPGTAGSHLGVADLTLAASPDGRWRPAGFRCALRAISASTGDGGTRALVRESPALKRVLETDHARTRARMSQPVGESPRALHSYFTFFAHDRALALVAAAQAAALRPLLKGTPAEGLPLLSAAAPGKFGARAGPHNFTDVPAGPLSLRHVADLHVFPNELRAVIVTGAQLLDWLEMSASLFHRVAPGSEGGPLVDPGMPGHDFDVLHGLSYRIDPSAPRRYNPDGSLSDPGGGRIRDARFDGRPVRPGMRFAVAINSFRASGGGHVRALAGAEPVDLPALTIRAALRDYLSGRLPADPLERAPQPWRFTPLPRTTVTVQTGPGARAHLAELTGRGVEVAGDDAEGFLRLILPL